MKRQHVWSVCVIVCWSLFIVFLSIPHSLYHVLKCWWFCSTVADGSESRVPPHVIWIMLQLTTEIRRSFFRSKDCGSSRLSNVEFGLHKLRSQTLYNGLDGQICCWTCLLNTVEVYWSAALQAIICSPCALNGLSPRITGFNERLRSNQCISLTKIWSVLCKICNSDVIC